MLAYLSQQHRVNANDIAVFFRQLATLTSAGIPLLQSCELLEKSQAKIKLQFLAYRIKRSVLSGKLLSQSLVLYPQYVDRFCYELVRIGEHTGQLDIMLIMVADYLEKRMALKKQLKRALFYPCIITVIALILTLTLFVFVIPRFAELFANKQSTLPLLTRFIFYLSVLLQRMIKPFFIFCIAVCLIVMHGKSRILIKKWLFRFFSSLPGINAIIHKIALITFVRHLALILSAGISLIDALMLAANTCQRTKMTDHMVFICDKICAGSQLHQAMEVTHYFPTFMVQMIKIGEESGKLEHMLTNIAAFMEAEVEQLLHYLHQLLEPLIMVVLGVLIGGLVIGMYLPIFKLGNTL